MAFEHILRKFQTPLNRYVIDESLLLLLPEQRNASTNLNHAEQFVVVCNDQLRLNEVGDVRVVVDASCDEPCACSQLSAARYEHDFELLAFEFELFLLDVALDDWDGPEWVNVLETKILRDLIVPQISLIQILLPEFVRTVFVGLELELHLVLPLKVARDVGVVAVVEALLFKNLLDSKNVLLDVGGHFIQVMYVLVEWDHLHNLDKVNKVPRRHPGHQLPLSDYNKKEMSRDVHDAKDSVGGPLPTSLVITFLPFCFAFETQR